MIDVTADSATVAWKSPLSDGGSPINTYVIERQDVKRGTWLNSGTVRVSGVIPTLYLCAFFSFSASLSWFSPLAL